jgi:uncharacterized membrane protein
MYAHPAFTLLMIPFTALTFPGLLLAAVAAWKAREFFGLLVVGLGRLGREVLRAAEDNDEGRVKRHDKRQHFDAASHA